MEMSRAYISKIAFREVLQAAFRYKWKMIIFFTAISSSIIAWVYLSPKIYQSEASILVRPGREFVQRDRSTLDSPGSPGPNFGDLLLSEMSVIAGRQLAENVVDVLGHEVVLNGPHAAPAAKLGAEGKLRATSSEALGLAKIKGDLSEKQEAEVRNEAVRMIMNNLGVTSKGNTIALTFDSKDPHSAQQILKTVLSEYFARHIEIHEAHSSLVFMRDRLVELGKELEASEAALDVFRGINKLAALESEKQRLIEAISALGADISHTYALEKSTAEQLVVLREAIQGRDERVEVSSTSGSVNPVSDFLRQQLFELQFNERDLQALYPDTHRPLIELRMKIADVEVALGKEPKTGQSRTIAINESYRFLQMKIDTAQADSAGYRAMRETKEEELVNLRENVSALAGHELTLSRLRRNVMTSEQEYLRYKDSLSRAEANAALDRARLSNVVVTQDATRPVVPFKPRKTRNIALGLILGFLGAVALGCFLDYTDDTLKSQSDVERFLGLPVLAIVSEEEFRSCT